MPEDLTTLTKDERDRLQAEMNRFRGGERRRQRRALVAVLVSVSVAVALTVPMLALALLFGNSLAALFVSFAPGVAVGGLVYRKFYPKDLWGR